MEPPHEIETGAPRQERARQVVQNQTQHIPNTRSVNFRKAGNFNEAEINAFFASRFLTNLSESMVSRSLRSKAYGGPWLLPPIPRVVVKTHRDERGYVTDVKWYDAESGTGGQGAIALIALVLGISRYEAAGRAAHFLSALMDSASFIEAA